MQVIVRRARNGAVGGGSMFAWGSVAASRDTASFELAGCIERTQKGKARKYDVLRLPRQRETCAFRPPGACIAALELPQRARWRVLACGLFGDKDVRLMKRLAGTRGGVGLRRHRHGDQERAERCAVAVPLFLRGGLLMVS